VLERLEDHDARPLAHHEAVAVLVERPAGLLRLVVARRERTHRGKSTDAHRRNRRFRSAGNHHFRIAAADDFVRFADGMSRRRACRARRKVRAARVESNRDLARRQVDDGRGNEERGDAPRAALQQLLVLGFNRLEPANAGRNEDADVIGNLGRDLQAGVVHGELRRRERVLDEDVHFLDVFLVDELQGIEALHLAGDAR
jgi:hypothetical protein